VSTGPIWFEIHVRDLARAEACYGAIAGWASGERVINAADGRFAQVRDPDGNLLGLWTT
jgi:predicted enzyme related to lactoylglutathione lyase